MSAKSCCCLVLLASICGLLSAQEEYKLAPYGPDDETALRNKILAGYDRKSRPYTPIGIYVDIILLSLNKLSIEDQEMSVTCVLYMIWHDHRLTWEPTDHKNMSNIVLDPTLIWLPRLVVENPIEKISVIGEEIHPPIRVSSSGYITWTVPTVLNVYCETRILNFPFDSQTCVIKMYAWGYTNEEIFVLPRQEYTSEDRANIERVYTPHGEWDYLDNWIKAENVPSGSVVIQRVKASLKFRRKWVFLSLTLIVPAVLCSLLMSAVFVLPFECGEKMSYSLTVLLTFIVLLTLVADSLPPISTEISLLQIYLTGVMCTGTLATLLTAWTVTMYSRPEGDPVPRWIVYVCDHGFKPFTCKTTASPSSSSSSSPRNNKSTTTSNSRSTSHTDVHSISHNLNNTQDISAVTNGRTSQAASNSGSSRSGVSSTFLNRPLPRFEPRVSDGSVTFSACASSRQYYTDRSEYSDSGSMYLPDDAAHFPESGGQFGGRPGPDDQQTTRTWKEVAQLVDAVCLRVISLSILAGTGSLVVFYSLSY